MTPDPEKNEVSNIRVRLFPFFFPLTLSMKQQTFVLKNQLSFMTADVMDETKKVIDNESRWHNELARTTSTSTPTPTSSSSWKQQWYSRDCSNRHYNWLWSIYFETKTTANWEQRVTRVSQAAPRTWRWPFARAADENIVFALIAQTVIYDWKKEELSACSCSRR